MAFQEVLEPITLSLPENLRFLPTTLLFTLGIAFYGILVYVFYRFLAKRDILSLNLKKYNLFEHAVAIKFFAIIGYLIQFIILIPVVITIWFGILSLLLIILLKGTELATILLISAVVIGAVRITSYYKEDLARDLAKMFPFTLLSVALVSTEFLEGIVIPVASISGLLQTIIYYGIFIAIIEIVLRLFFVAYKAITSGGEDLGFNADYVEVEEQRI
jgi:hypothetical protein